ncbi:hypothetical protein C4097_00120 [Clostridioides difficile]|nr:hypothetical protein [Clostridioides difficile]
MKKLLVILLCLIVSIGLVACSSGLENDLDVTDDENQIYQSSNDSSNESSEDEPYTKPSDNISTDNNSGNETEKTISIETSQIFKDIYEKNQDQIGQISFNLLKEQVKSLGYKHKITEPTTDDLGRIEVYDNNSSDSIILGTYPDENGLETLDLMQYNRGDRCISISDSSHTKSPHYSNYNGTNNETYGVDSQIEFLFGNE